MELEEKWVSEKECKAGDSEACGRVQELSDLSLERQKVEGSPEVLLESSVQENQEAALYYEQQRQDLMAQEADLATQYAQAKTTEEKGQLLVKIKEVELHRKQIASLQRDRLSTLAQQTGDNRYAAAAAATQMQSGEYSDLVLLGTASGVGKGNGKKPTGTTNQDVGVKQPTGPEISPIATHKPIDDLIADASKPINATGLSQEAHAWDKHDTSRKGGTGTFEPLKGNIQQKNEFVNKWIRGVLTNPNTVKTNLSRGGVEYRLPNGQGVRFESNGKINFMNDKI